MKLKKYILFLSIISILIILFILILITDNNIKIGIYNVIERARNQANTPLISYKVVKIVDSDNDLIETVITFFANEGIETIEYNDSRTSNLIKLNCHNKVKASIDYLATDGNEYTFKIKKKNQNEKEEKIKIEIPRIQGNYTLNNTTYVYEPDVSQMNPNYTRYLDIVTINNIDYLTPGNWINDSKPVNWYDYGNRKWANILVENEGLESYYVWIPRYCFKLDQTNQVSDVKFIDIYNNYKDSSGNITDWKTLRGQGYQVPEAFCFDGTYIPGYWVMKYTAGTRDIFSLYFDALANKDNIYIKNVSTNTNETIAKYTYAINGKVIGEQTTNDNFPKYAKDQGDIEYYINVTALDANGEVLGTMTKKAKTPKINPPDTSKFNQDTTFYVTYDDKANEHSSIPITQSPPEDWYDYVNNNWANIVTRNNGLETYYTWIPRYEFRLNQTSQTSAINFIEGINDTPSIGYQIPEAFTFNGVPLTGFWVMKYTAGGEYASKFDSDITAYGNKIKTKGISGTSVNTGQKYNYYINGTLKGSTTNASDIFEFTNLNENTLYTINIEIRTNDANDTYLGSITKQVKTISPNEPNFKGFALDKAKYILYDDTGTNEIVGDIIKYDGYGRPTNMPNNWYDYASNKWANILIEANGKKTYYTWIPRYCFRLDQTNQKSVIEFLSGTSQDVPSGYQIPEAFTFNKVPLTGFWVMKYTAGN